MCQPTGDINSYASDVNGIDMKALLVGGAQPLEAALDAFCEFCLDAVQDNGKIYVVAHNCKNVEQKILGHWLLEAKTDLTTEFLERVRLTPKLVYTIF